MSSKKIQTTKNYKLFNRSVGENRPLDMKKHKKLIDSMKLYGFLECFPIVVERDEKGDLIVKDGQHRLAVAEMLELPVHWIEDDTDFDIAIINNTPKTWTPRDFALKFVASGKEDYQIGLDFAEQHQLPIGVAFALVGGTTTFSNVSNDFTSGNFRVRDLDWAKDVAGIYRPIVEINPRMNHVNFIGACMAVCRVPHFDAKRFLRNANACREKLVVYSTRDGFLEMMEEIYNFRQSKLVGLKAEAKMVMRHRNVAKRNDEPEAISDKE